MAGLYRIGTRKSRLATTQSNWVRAELAKLGVASDLVEIVSEGDVNYSTPLYAIEGTSPGVFVKQLEVELQKNTIDLAVHSLKDLPTVQPSDLKLACVPPREVTGDCLLVSAAKAKAGEALQLPRGAKVGTSSLRREAQLLDRRADVNCEPIRGNVPTRVQAVREGLFDAVILAQAGLRRLQLDLTGIVKVDLPEDFFIPAPGQGALGIETRTDVPTDLLKGLAELNDESAFTETRLERRVLRLLEGGCSLPLGVRCRYDSSKNLFFLNAFLGLQKDRKHAPRDWVSFHRFDISEAKEETLVDKTVDYFRGVIERRPKERN